MKRDQVLDKAKSLISGDRQEDYGDAAQSFNDIAAGWNIIVSRAIKQNGKFAPLSPTHVALMMDWLKTTRLLNDTSHQDSWVDKAGYSALGAEIGLSNGEKR
jgi:hypothetical protein